MTHLAFQAVCKQSTFYSLAILTYLDSCKHKKQPILLVITNSRYHPSLKIHKTL